MDIRTLLSAVIGVVVGLVFLRFPEIVVRVNLGGRLPTDRRGEYGSDSEPSLRVRRLVQSVGVLLIIAGVYFGYSLLS
ncbi:hypothetical protein ACEU6E_02310 [Halorutilales archaeon Cl-col2-1]